jgi:hypothetical protein
MSYYALIKDGVVDQLIVADYDFIERQPNVNDWVEVSDNPNDTGTFANRGYIYNAESKTFSAPQIPIVED